MGSLPYSCRNASLGSTRIAFLAGAVVASTITAANSPIAARYATGSSGRSPKISLRNADEIPAAPSMPPTNPIPTGRSIGVRTARTTCVPRAPSAIRTPISRVRCPTV